MTAGLTARVLSQVDGERLLTDLRHVGQSLHQVATEERLGLVALLTWLRAQMADDKVEVASDRTRRLDSDAAAVQLVTIHGSKGLEYPVVYLPTLWDRFPQDPAVPLFHSDADDGPRTAASTSPAADRTGATTSQRAQDRGRRRVAAPALRRDDPRPHARSSPGGPRRRRTPRQSPLQRMLFGRTARLGGRDSRPRSLHDEEDVARILDSGQRARRAGLGGGPARRPAHRAPPRRRAAARRCGAFTRDVDTTVAAHVVLLPQRRRRRARRRPRRGRQRAGGATQGRRARAGRRREPPVAMPSADAVVPRRWPVCRSGRRSARWCTPCSSTPTRPPTTGEPSCARRSHEQLVAGRFRLDRRRAGRRPGRGLRQPARAARRRRHAARHRRSPTGCARWTSSCRWPAATCAATRPRSRSPSATWRRCCERTCPTATRCCPTPTRWPPGARGRRTCAATSPGRSTWCCGCPRCAGASRYLVVDYKTNWLGGLPGTGAPALSSDDYRPEVLRAAMAHSDYPLQALLYAVVLHRFLRWRQPGYDPSDAPRRRAVPLPARHVRAGHPGRRRPAVRGVRVAPAGGAGRGALGPPGRATCAGVRRHGSTTRQAVGTLDHPRRCVECREPWELPADAADRRLALSATGLLADFNGPACSPPPTCTSPRRSAGWRASRDERRAARGRAGRPGRAPRLRRASTSRRSPTWRPSSRGPSPTRGRRRSRRARCVASGVRAPGVRAALPRPLPAPGGRALPRPQSGSRRRPPDGRRRPRSTRACRGSSPATPTTSSVPRAAGGAAVDHRADRWPGHRQDHHGRRAAGAAGRAGSSSPGDRRCASR